MTLMNLDPSTFFTSSLAVRVPNVSNFSSPDYEAAIAAAFAAIDQTTLAAALQTLDRALIDEASSSSRPRAPGS